MSLVLPLEDNFTDVIGKAQRGLGLTDALLAEHAAASIAEIQALKEGVVAEAVLTKVAVRLGLGKKALLALAQSHYEAACVPEMEGLAHFNTLFQKITVNAFLVWDPTTRKAALFDTGADGQPMVDFAKSHDLQILQIFLTHIHMDHIFDLDRLIEKTNAHAFVCEREPLKGAEGFKAGQSFRIGNLHVETRLTSGHAAGGITYFIRGLAHPVAVVGDAMFAASMGGAADAYTEALRNNREQILTLPEETILCPGHGPLTTVGEQKFANPFFAA